MVERLRRRGIYDIAKRGEMRPQAPHFETRQIEIEAQHQGAYRAAYSCAVTYAAVTHANVCDITTDKMERQLLKNYWDLARSDTRFAKGDLDHIGKSTSKVKPPSPFLPRTNASVRNSVVGRSAALFRAANARASALEPCQALRDLLAAQRRPVSHPSGLRSGEIT